MSKGLVSAAADAGELASSAVDVEKTLAGIGRTASDVGTIGDAFNGFGTKLKSFITSPTGILTAAVAVGALAVALEDAFTIDYGEANKAAEESASKYQESKSSLESLNSELESTKSRMAELQSLKSAGTITFAEESELQKLQSTNDELEKKITLQEKLVSLEAKSAMDDAKEAMSKKSHSVAQSVEAGDSKGEQSFKGIIGKVTDTEAIKENLKALDKFQSKLDDVDKRRIKLEKQKANREFADWEYKARLKSLNEEQKQYEDSIKTLNNDLSERSSVIQEHLDTLKIDPITNASEIKELENTLNSISNMDLSPVEQHLNALNSFFDGSTGKNFIKDQLLDAAKSGENVLSVLRDMGLSLGDLGLEGKGGGVALKKYFDDLAESAKEAESAMKGVDGTLQGVAEASQSENSGKNWSDMAGYIKNAKELFDKGKVGTDDFQTVAQWMTPTKINEDAYKYDADAYVAAWESAYNKVSRWFDSENPSDSMWNFWNDLDSVNDSLVDIDHSTGEIIPKFKTTAEAAKELGVNTEVVDTILHNLEDYGFEFDDVIFSGEALTSFEDSLNGIKDIYDKMSSGESKNRLGKLIEGWDQEYAIYENDLSQLTEDQVVHIEFEYNLATIQQKLDELEAKQKGQGGKNAETNAEIIAGNAQYLSTAKEGLGLSKEGIQIPTYFQAAEGSVENLYNQLSQAKKGSAEYFEIQAKIQNTQELQQDLYNAFSEQHPEINADSNIDEINQAWSAFFNTPQHISVDAKLEKSDVESQLENLGKGSTISFKADINSDGVAEEIQAIKNEDNTITYHTEVDGEIREVELHKDGTITYTGDFSNVDNAPEKPGLAPYKADFSGLPPNAPARNGVAPYSGDFSGIPNAPTRYGTAVYTAVFGGAGNLPNLGDVSSGGSQLLKTKSGYISKKKLNGTAHASGDWSVKKSETALVGELGQEAVVRNGKFFTVGNHGAEFANIRKGDIIFNHLQTAQLFKNGYVTSGGGRAKVVGGAFAEGTAYATGGRLPIGGGSYKSTTPKKKATSSANNAKQSVSSAAQATEDALEAISHYFDWIKVRLDRLSRESDIAEKAIETAVGLSAKQSATSNAISKVQSEMDAARQGYDRYMSHANWFASQSGLSTDIQQRAQDGTIDITKYDDDTKKKISEYQNWYEEALNCLDKVSDLEEKESELAQKRLENIEDFYDLVVKVHESLQDVNDSSLKMRDALGFSAVSDAVKDLYQSSIDESKKIYQQMDQQLTDYQNEFNNLVTQGYIKEGSDEWYKGKAQINDFTKALNESIISLMEFEEKLREVEYTKIQQLIDGFERAVSKIDAKIELSKARDEVIPESVYQKQMDANNSRIQSNEQMREVKLEKQTLYAVESKEYQDLADEISKLDEETYKLLTDNEKLKDTIFELRFTPIDEGIKKYQSLRDEIKDFQGLLNEDAFFDKNGAITGEGLANIALLQQSMIAGKQEIADYRKGLDKLQESFDNSVISEKEFNEKSEEYRKGIRDSVTDVEKYQDSLTDLYMTQMKTEVDALQKVINLRKEALDRKAAYYDYDKKLKDKSKDVNLLKSQIAALEGVNNIQAQSEKKRLEAQLREAQDELDETKRDHALDMQKQGYDGLSSDMEEILENTEYEIAHNADKQKEVISSMLNTVVGMYQDAYSKINSIISNTGFVGSNGFNQNQNDLSNQGSANNQAQDALRPQPDVKPSKPADSTVTDKIENDDEYHQKVEDDLIKEPDTKNRPVAEIRLSKSSVSVQEGQNTNISALVRPTDAKNQTLKWESSNPNIATVSNGAIHGVKPGSCTITVSSTDGGGATPAECSVTVTKKPDPPKPAPPPAYNGGDGIPRVGDVVTLEPGQRYYHDSWGARPAGNLYSGVHKGVVIDGYSGVEYGGASRMHGSFGIHIKSADGRYGDLGWVRLDQISGYEKGTGANGVLKDQLAWTQEKGREMVFRKSDGAMLTRLNQGDRVLTNKLTENLMDWGTVNPSQVLSMYSHIPEIDRSDREIRIEQHYDCLLNVEGNVDKNALPDLEKMIDLSFQRNMDRLRREVVKSGGRRKR